MRNFKQFVVKSFHDLSVASLVMGFGGLTLNRLDADILPTAVTFLVIGFLGLVIEGIGALLADLEAEVESNDGDSE